MTQKIRQDQILDILEKRQYATVLELIDILGYSSATVNRDLNSMQTLGLVKRSRGGVELAERSNLPPLYSRQFYKKQEKRRIAKAAAALVEDGDTLFLNGGTTVQYMVPFLLNKKNLRIITYNLHIAIEFGMSDFEVICLGGHIVERPYVLGGDETVENAMRYKADKLFFSVGKVSEDGLIDASSYLLHKTMIKNSQEAWFLTDKTKLTNSIDVALCDFSEMTGIISDFCFPEETKKQYPNVKFITAE